MQLLIIIQICSPARILTPIPIRVFLPHTKLPSPPSTATAPPPQRVRKEPEPRWEGHACSEGGYVAWRRGTGALPRLGPLYGHLESPADGRFRKRIDKDQRVENAMSRKEGAACWRPGTTQPQFLIVFRRKVSWITFSNEERGKC